MINIYNFIRFLIYTSAISFFIPFGGKSISLCEIFVPIFSFFLLIQQRNISLKYTKQELLFFVSSLSKIFTKNFITLLRISSSVLFLTSINHYKTNNKLIRVISNTFFNTLTLISSAALVNLLIGNVKWTGFLLSINLLPLNVIESSFNSWWNDENGIVSFFVTQNMLVQYVFLLYILLLIMNRMNILTRIKFRLATFYTIFLLFFSKTTLGSFGLLLIFLYYLKENLIQIIKSILDNFIKLKIRLSNLFLLSILGSFIFIFINYWKIINLQINSGLIFIKGLINMDLITVTYEVFDTSEFHRLKYAQLFLENIDKCKLFGPSSFINITTYNPHNFYLNIAHLYGLAPLFLYLVFILLLFFNGLKNKYISEIYKLLSIYIFVAGFQGDLFGDTRAILPFVFIIFICRNNYSDIKEIKKINF
tara:strand:- start:939 stop:2201 length:1263 start_codon:yes stop_codon:yes gene_type:complete